MHTADELLNVFALDGEKEKKYNYVAIQGTIGDIFFAGENFPFGNVCGKSSCGIDTFKKLQMSPQDGSSIIFQTNNRSSVKNACTCLLWFKNAFGYSGSLYFSAPYAKSLCVSSRPDTVPLIRLFADIFQEAKLRVVKMNLAFGYMLESCL